MKKTSIKTTSRRSSENPTNSGARDVPRSPEPEPDRWADAHHAGHAADRSLEQGHAVPSVSVSLTNAGGPRHRVPAPPRFNGARRLRIIGSRKLAAGPDQPAAHTTAFFTVRRLRSRFEIIRYPARNGAAHRARTRSAVSCGAKVTIGLEVYSGRKRC